MKIQEKEFQLAILTRTSATKTFSPLQRGVLNSFETGDIS